MNQFVEKYGQILLPLITPYDANEEVDYGKYAELIEYLIQNDLCDSLIVTVTMPSTVTATMTSSSTRRIRQCSRTATAEMARRTLSFMSFICPPKR